MIEDILLALRLLRLIRKAADKKEAARRAIELLKIQGSYRP